MALRHGFVFLVYLFSTLKIAQCGGRLSLKFISFENPGHRLQNRRCCDNVRLCLNNCDVFLRLCMGLRSQGLCSLLNIQTATLGDDSFRFGPSLGNGHSNPIVYKFSQWTEPFKLRVTSLDDDGGSIIGSSADLISTNDFDIAHAPGINADSAVTRSETLRGYRSTLKLNYKIYCDTGYFKPSCNEYCRTTDDSSGHYTCDFDNSKKICMDNWYGPSCTTFCQAQNSNLSGHYICSSNGTKICLPGWYGVMCNRYCIARDNATGHYTCNSEGNKICMTNWYGEDCTKHCDIRVTEHFKCLDSGRKVCRDDWFGTNCTRYCKPVSGPKENYTCSKNGTKICGTHWFGTNCTRYCKPVSGPKANYTCSKNGTKMCGTTWFGTDCTLYCKPVSGPKANYTCSENGTKICGTHWFGTNCTLYCKPVSGPKANYTCSENGTNICGTHWFGTNCTRYCKPVIGPKANYTCSVNGTKICGAIWFGTNCTRYCKPVSRPKVNYTCSDNGTKICGTHWFGTNCTRYCKPVIGPKANYTCSENGTKICGTHWFGTNCTRYCKPFSGPKENYTCSKNGTKICGTHWFGTNCTRYCKPVSGPKANYTCSKNGTKICGTHWFGTKCTRYCKPVSGPKINYTCSENGTKICSENWFGDNCNVYCRENTSTQFSCDASGRKICNAGWYGINCLKYIGCIESTSVESRYFCDNSTGKMVCRDGWTGDQCQMRNNSSQNSIYASLIKPSTSRQIIAALATTLGLNEKIVTSISTTILSAQRSTDTIQNTNGYTKTSSAIRKRQHNTLKASETRGSVVMVLGSVTLVTAMVSTKMTSTLFKNGGPSAISGDIQGTVSSREHLLKKSLQATLVPKITKVHGPTQKNIISSHTRISDQQSKFVSFASKIPKQNTSIHENPNREETSRFRIMAYVSGPFLLCVALLFTIFGIKKLLLRKSARVKRIKLEPEISRPLMTGFLKSTRIPSEEFYLSAIIEEPRPQDSLLGYREV